MDRLDLKLDRSWNRAFWTLSKKKKKCFLNLPNSFKKFQEKTTFKYNGWFKSIQLQPQLQALVSWQIQLIDLH